MKPSLSSAVSAHTPGCSPAEHQFNKVQPEAALDLSTLEETISVEQAIEDLRSLAVRSRPTYHAFAYSGQYLLYDLCSGALVDLNAASFVLLRGLEDGEDAKAIERNVADAGGLNIISFVRELKEFYDLGLFRSEQFEADDVRKQTLKALAEHAPRNIMLLVHTACNLACDYCYEVISGFHGSGGRMTLDTAKNILDIYFAKATARKAVCVTFFGGEPLLNFSVIEGSVEYCRAYSERSGLAIGYSITTNGTLLTDAIIQFLVNNKFSVMLSIDGEPAKADIHRHTKGGVGATREAIEKGLRLVQAQRSAGIREALIRSTLTKDNSSHIDAHNYLYTQGFRRIMIGYSAPRAHHPAKPWDLEGEALKQTIVEHDKLLHEYANASCLEEISPAARKLESSLEEVGAALDRPVPKALLGCGVGNNMLAYAADGRIFPCHRFANENSYQLGKIGQGGLNHERLERFYSDIIKIRTEVCGKCWARFICIGKCPWELADPSGTVRSAGWQECDSLRSGFEKNLWLYKVTRVDRPPTHTHDTGTLGGCGNV